MNKGRRNELCDLHWKRRLVKRRSHAPWSVSSGMDWSFRDQSCPCSCWCCDPHKHGEHTNHATYLRLKSAEDLRQEFVQGAEYLPYDNPDFDWNCTLNNCVCARDRRGEPAAKRGLATRARCRRMRQAPTTQNPHPYKGCILLLTR